MEATSTWLGEVLLHEYEPEIPLLSPLIHKGNDREQGDGFYKMCEEIYGEDWKTLKANPDFEINAIKKCYSFWKNDDNYKAFKNDY